MVLLAHDDGRPSAGHDGLNERYRHASALAPGARPGPVGGRGRRTGRRGLSQHRGDPSGAPRARRAGLRRDAPSPRPARRTARRSADPAGTAAGTALAALAVPAARRHGYLAGPYAPRRRLVPAPRPGVGGAGPPPAQPGLGPSG